MAIDRWPFYPVEIGLYIKAIGDAQQALDRARHVLVDAADRYAK